MQRNIQVIKKRITNKKTITKKMNNKQCEKDCRYNINNTCYNPHPLISCGNKKKEKVKCSERRTPLSNKVLQAYKYHIKGKSFSWISNKLKVAKSTAFDYVKKGKGLYKDNKGVLISNDKGFSVFPNVSKKGLKRLHNDVVSFLIEPVEFWGEPNIVKLKFAKYLLIKEKGLHIQLFERKLVVRFLEDITCKTIRECKDKASNRIIEFLKGFRYKGVRFLNGRYEQVSRHYAILGSDIAKRVIREKKKFFVFDKVDGKRRLVVDFSKRNPEFEAEHNIKGFGDGVTSEAYFEVMINNPEKFDDPVTTKSKLDSLIFNVDKFAKNSNVYAENIELHLKVLKSMEVTLKKMEGKLK